MKLTVFHKSIFVGFVQRGDFNNNTIYVEAQQIISKDLGMGM
jgi:hypothetical protein